MAEGTKVLPLPKLRVRPLEKANDLWLFLDYGGGENERLDYRWAIHTFPFPNGGDWWGVRALFSDTHERWLHGVAEEMKLAQQAIDFIRQARQRPQAGP